MRVEAYDLDSSWVSLLATPRHRSVVCEDCGVTPQDTPGPRLAPEGNEPGDIEVFVTHSIEDPRAQFFDQQDIPWIEVRVTSEDFYEGPDSWTA